MFRPWTQVFRSLARRPVFAITAVAVLAAGIGATTGVFSVVDTAVLEPLPYPTPDRLVVVLEANAAKSEAAGLLAPARIEDWNRLNHTFDAIAGVYGENVTETSGELPERLASLRVSPRFFSVFRMRPEVGRTFAADEEVNGGPAAVVISDRLWERRFHRAKDVTSHRLTLTGRSYAIIGVMPAAFNDGAIDLWIPAQSAPSLMQARDARFYSGVGRMKAGVTVDAAQRDLAGVQAELGREYPKTDANWSALVTDLKASRVGQYREPLVFVLGAVTLLFLIALANTAGLMLTQLQRRESELAIRGFLGATRAQVAGGVLQEMLILAGAATVVALVADAALLRLASAALASLPRAQAIHVDWRALGVAALCTGGAAIICGALPAWRATRDNVAATLSRTGRGNTSGSRAERWLVAGQFALGTLLLSSTGLMLRSYYNLTHVDTGFDASHSATFHVGAAWDEDRVAVGQMQEKLLDALQNIPGVTAAGFSNFLPASDATLRFRVKLQSVARDETTDERDLLTLGERGVTRDYFAALGARVSAGTSCPAFADMHNTQPKVLVNRRFVTTYAGGRSVVGQFLGWGPDRPGGTPMEIVGVVDDIREDNLRTAPVPYMYICLGPGDWPDPEYVVRTRGDARALIAAIRGAVHATAPGRAIFGAMTLDDVVAATLGQTRLQAVLISAFGLGALALAVLGLYSLVSLAVTAKRREIGIRIALGAAPGRVVGELTARVVRLVAAGTAVGLVLTVIAQRELRAVVFGVAPLDAATLVVAVLALGLAAGAAMIVPAVRAARISPVEAMR